MQQKGSKALEEMKQKATGKRKSLAPLPTVEELRSALTASENSGTRKLIASLFDNGTFSELGV